MKFLIVGCGGTGGYLIQYLAAQLKENFEAVLVDGDTVAPNNIPRQLFNTLDIGLNKAKVLAGRYNETMGCKLIPIGEFLTEEMLKGFLQEDFTIITCTDQNKVRVMVHEMVKETKHCWIDSGNELKTGQVVKSVVGTERSKDVIDLHQEMLKESTSTHQCGTGPAQSASINQFCASVCAKLAIDQLGGNDSPAAVYLCTEPLTMSPLWKEQLCKNLKQ